MLHNSKFKGPNSSTNYSNIIALLHLQFIIIIIIITFTMNFIFIDKEVSAECEPRKTEAIIFTNLCAENLMEGYAMKLTNPIISTREQTEREIGVISKTEKKS